MYQILELALSGPFHALGFIIILFIIIYFPCDLIIRIVHKSIRAKTIRQVGYPPTYCDGDGDFKNEEIKN